MAPVGRIVVIELSSSDDEDDETVSGRKDKKTAFSSVTNPNHCSVVEVITKEEKERDDDECCILAFDPFDLLTDDLNRSFSLDNYHKLKKGAEEDLAIISGRKDKKTAFSSVTNPNHCSVVEVITKEEKERDDDECCILAFDPFDLLTDDLNRSFSLDNHRKLKKGAEEDLAIIAERGKVACKDYPHSRHHCAEYPFDKTPHESCCTKCYCYVCDEVAPCVFWKANPSGHCHASHEEENWRNLRLSTRISQREQNFSNQSIPSLSSS